MVWIMELELTYFGQGINKIASSILISKFGSFCLGLFRALQTSH